jgi:hypothetical protein
MTDPAPALTASAIDRLHRFWNGSMVIVYVGVNVLSKNSKDNCHPWNIMCIAIGC